MKNGLKNLTLITGGARSGKSSYAEDMALASNKTVYYFATMPYITGDVEQEERIRKHKQRRPQAWQTIECEQNLHEAISELPSGDAFCIVDCISLYISNLFYTFEHHGGALWHQSNLITQHDSGVTRTTRFGELEKIVHQQIELLSEAVHKAPGKTFVIVTNEVGLGVVPDNELSRRYRDFLGDTNKILAERAGSVWLCCAGLHLQLK